MVWGVAGVMLAAAMGAGILVYWLLVDRGRLLLRVDALEARLLAAGGHTGVSLEDEVRMRSLPVGSRAPDLALPDVNGSVHELAERRGQWVILVFLDPGCDACLRLIAPLADALASAPSPAASVMVVGAGEVSDISRLTAPLGAHGTVLVDAADRRARETYQIGATPSAYLVDPEGIVDRPVALGIDEILALVGRAAGNPAATNGLRLRPLSESRLNRSGLSPGTRAPDFDLPRVGGGRLSLRDFRGQPLLLVFSDPLCAPCDELGPHLERMSRERKDLAVAVISRGEAYANEQKIAEQGLTCPVALQRHWMTSREYGMFATPAAYLIDAEGVVRSPVALGVEPILALGRESVAESIEGGVL